jgi:hypothetical protein
MLKFLRRYNKAILMVGGSILMVLFLLPTTTQQLGQNVLSQAVAYIGGEKVTFMDLQRAAQQLQIIERLAPTFLERYQIDTRRPEHWLMLVHEARRAGMLGGPKEAWKEVPQAAADMIRASTPSPAAADSMVLELQGVARLIGVSNPAPVFSTREAVALGRRVLDVATLDLVLIPADKAAESLPAPDDARLTAHFEKYRDIVPGQPAEGNPLGFGYRRPPAVQVEWMAIDRASVEAAYSPDAVEVYKFWSQNKTQWPGEFTDVKAQVESEFERRHVDQVMERVADALRRELFRSTSPLPGDGVFKSLPDDWGTKMPPFASLATIADAELRREFPSLTQGPSVMPNDGTWRTRDDLSRLPGVGFATLPFGAGTRIPFGDIAMMCRELAPQSTLGIQKGMVYGPLSDYRGSSFYFRVLDTRLPGPAESPAEVREAMIRDLKTLDGIDKLKFDAGAYKERAIADGLTAVANKETLFVRTGVEVTDKMVRVAANMGSDVTLDTPEFRDAVMTLARALDPKVDATTLDPAGRTVSIVLNQARGLVVAQITRFRPMTIETFRTNARTVAESAASEFGVDLMNPAFTYDRLKERLGFKTIGDEPPDKKPESDTTPSPAPATGS